MPNTLPLVVVTPILYHIYTAKMLDTKQKTLDCSDLRRAANSHKTDIRGKVVRCNQGFILCFRESVWRYKKVAPSDCYATGCSTPEMEFYRFFSGDQSCKPKGVERLSPHLRLTTSKTLSLNKIKLSLVVSMPKLYHNTWHKGRWFIGCYAFCVTAVTLAPTTTA